MFRKKRKKTYETSQTKRWGSISDRKSRKRRHENHNFPSLLPFNKFVKIQNTYRSELNTQSASAKGREKQTWIWTKTARGPQKALLREKRNKSKPSIAGIVAASLSLKPNLVSLIPPNLRFRIRQKHPQKNQKLKNKASDFQLKESPLHYLSFFIRSPWTE